MLCEIDLSTSNSLSFCSLHHSRYCCPSHSPPYLVLLTVTIPTIISPPLPCFPDPNNCALLNLQSYHHCHYITLLQSLPFISVTQETRNMYISRGEHCRFSLAFGILILFTFLLVESDSSPPEFQHSKVF